MLVAYATDRMSSGTVSVTVKVENTKLCLDEVTTYDKSVVVVKGSAD